MSKKILEELRSKTVAELEKERHKLLKEVAQLKLTAKVNQPKDSSVWMKKRKELAWLLTIATEKKNSAEKED